MIGNIPLSPDDLAFRTRWYIYLRWFILLAALIPALLSVYIEYGWSSQLRDGIEFGLIALMTNVIFFVLSRLFKDKATVRSLISTIFIVDIAIITYFIYTKGGIESRSVVLYVLPIIMSSAIFGRRGAYELAVLSALAYDGLILCNYFGLFSSLNLMNPRLQTDFIYVINTILFFNALLILTSMVVDFLARLLISKERLATQRLKEVMRAQSIAKLGTWEWNKSDNVVRWSDELYEIFGIKKDSQLMTFEQYIDFVHPDDREKVSNSTLQASEKNLTFSFDYRIVLADGSIRYIYSNGQSYCDKTGNVTHMVGSARDITESKLLENAKNDFVAVTSHQLRTPATIVKQYATMLSEGYAGEMTKSQKSFLQTIYDSNERQIAIINDLLSIARIDSGNFNMNLARIDIVPMLKQIRQEHIGKFKAKQQRLVFKPKYQKVLCEVDGDQIKMVIENLLDNAHKYTPAKKTIRIELKRHRKGVSIMISDKGIGIPAKDIHKIFDMFSRIDNPAVLQEEGTGIGLYWAKKIITMHKGSIDVQSEHAKGTTFTITLPYRATRT